MSIAGFGVLLNPPPKFESVIGLVLVYVFGSFVTAGALLGVVAVLPGIWWLERVAILALSTGLAMYVVMAISLGSTPVVYAITTALILTFIQRWFEIKGAQLAPRER
jgi:hypothetical protein